MRIDVRSEVGQLAEVLTHRPGTEIVRMTQHDLDAMLFDDILAPSVAAREHAMVTEIMRAAGAKVHQLAVLLNTAIAHADKEQVLVLLTQCCQLARCPTLIPYLADLDPLKLSRTLIEGLYWDECKSAGTSLARIRAKADRDDAMALPPLPNLMFMRDPCFTVFDRVVRSRMATAARAREPLLVAFALQYQPNSSIELSFVSDRGLDESFDGVEGGDVLVLSPQAIVIGCSERTNASTLERLTRESLFVEHPSLQRVYAVLMPKARSVMHLDTILTQIDHNLFLGHMPLVATPGHAKSLPVACLAREQPAVLLEGATVLDMLRQELGPKTEIVPCGGRDPLHQEREQWTDGANAVALAPGQIMIYARNRHTVRTLAEHDFSEVHLPIEHGPDERREQVNNAMRTGRTVFTFKGSELSRARGGGRCLTMPLRRTLVTDPDMSTTT